MAATDKLRGFVGQSMAARKSFRDALLAPIAAVDVTSGSGSVVASRPCTALIFVWGAGASGGTTGVGSAAGSGAAAGFKRVRLAFGQSLAYSVGAPGAAAGSTTTNGNSGGDSIVTLPSGLVLTAGGGKTNVGAVAGPAGIATNFDVNRNGGIGGSAGAGAAGDHGGAGGAASGSNGGGGGGGGFSDFLPGAGYAGGAGSTGETGGLLLPGGNYGGGSGVTGGGSGNGQPGGLGRVAIWLIRAS